MLLALKWWWDGGAAPPPPDAGGGGGPLWPMYPRLVHRPLPIGDNNEDDEEILIL